MSRGGASVAADFPLRRICSPPRPAVALRQSGYSEAMISRACLAVIAGRPHIEHTIFHRAISVSFMSWSMHMIDPVGLLEDIVGHARVLDTESAEFVHDDGQFGLFDLVVGHGHCFGYIHDGYKFVCRESHILILLSPSSSGMEFNVDRESVELHRAEVNTGDAFILYAAVPATV